MRAVATAAYGGPDVLSVQEVPDPKVGPDSVLIRVRAASINPVDYKIVAGRLDGAFPVIWPLVPGWDVAGEVVAVGPAVSRPAVGEEVFGYARLDHLGGGTWAELVALPARSVAVAPAVPDAQAAACLPLAGLTAWQGLVDSLDVGHGDCVLIHAGAGGVGHLAVQIAASRGARVIATAAPADAGYLEELGAEPVGYGDGFVDRVTAIAPAGVDAIFDLVGGEALDASPKLLREAARRPLRVVSVVDAAKVKALGGSYLFVRPDAGGLGRLAELADDGRLVPRVHAVYPLAAVREAVGAAMHGHPRSKIVLRVD